MRSVVDYLEGWVATQPDKLLFAFVDSHGREREQFTYQQFHERTCGLATYLSKYGSVTYGARVLLVYPPGLELVVAFFACARLGAIPVPVAPVRTVDRDAGTARLDAVAKDCQASV